MQWKWTACESADYVPAHEMYLLMLVLYVCNNQEIWDAKTCERFWPDIKSTAPQRQLQSAEMKSPFEQL